MIHMAAELKTIYTAGLLSHPINDSILNVLSVLRRLVNPQESFYVFKR